MGEKLTEKYGKDPGKLPARHEGESLQFADDGSRVWAQCIATEDPRLKVK